MTNKQMLSTSLLLLTFSACSAVQSDESTDKASVSEDAERQPNIIIVFTDDQGWGDLSCYGHPTISTPHLDRMAAEGMRLTQFYVASPVCTPSRAALMTGCYPRRVGLHQGVILPQHRHGLHPEETTIPEMLQEQGYATGMVGKWHLGHEPELLPPSQGFEMWFGAPYSNDMSRREQLLRRPDSNYQHVYPIYDGYERIEEEPDQALLTRRLTERAVQFIDDHADEPFFLYLAHPQPHVPIYAHPEMQGTSLRGAYGDSIEEIDWSVGRLREALEHHELDENTLVIFTSDNGPWLPYGLEGGSAGLLRDGKGTCFEGGQRVPCVVWWPQGVPAGVIQREVMTTIDILPTLAGLTGAALPEREIDGFDAGGMLFGDADATSPREHFLYYSRGGAPTAIRRGPWKLWLESGELYQLEHDPGERRNQAQAHPDLVAELRVLAEAEFARIDSEARDVWRAE